MGNTIARKEMKEIIEEQHINIEFLKLYTLKYYNINNKQVKNNIFELYIKCGFPRKIHVTMIIYLENPTIIKEILYKHIEKYNIFFPNIERESYVKEFYYILIKSYDIYLNKVRY